MKGGRATSESSSIEVGEAARMYQVSSLRVPSRAIDARICQVPSLGVASIPMLVFKGGRVHGGQGTGFLCLGRPVRIEPDDARQRNRSEGGHVHVGQGAGSPCFGRPVRTEPDSARLRNVTNERGCQANFRKQKHLRSHEQKFKHVPILKDKE